MKMSFFKHAIAAAALAALPVASISAQETGGSKWYFGLGGGYHSTHMGFSDINEDVFPENKNMGSGVFSVFAMGEFGREGNFALRPQLSFLTRGGKLTEINSKTLDYAEEGIDDIYYRLRSRYIDIRVPVIYQFGKQSSVIGRIFFVPPRRGQFHALITTHEVGDHARYLQQRYSSAGTHVVVMMFQLLIHYPAYDIPDIVHIGVVEHAVLPYGYSSVLKAAVYGVAYELRPAVSRTVAAEKAEVIDVVRGSRHLVHEILGKAVHILRDTPAYLLFLYIHDIEPLVVFRTGAEV